MDFTAATDVLNVVATILFFLLLGATIFSMVRRLRLYQIAKTPVPVLLKALLVLIGALLFIASEAVVLRLLGVTLERGTPERFLYALQADVILIAALAYYTKVEFTDVDDEDKP